MSRKKTKQIESKKHSEQYEQFVSKVLRTDNVFIGDMDVNKVAELLEWLDNAPVEQMADRRQADADLWEMLSFRNTSFADIIHQMQACIEEGKAIPQNLMEKYAMCVIRATFRDLVKKGVDEYQTAVYDDFRHDIRLEMSRRMANATAYEVNRNRKGDMVRAGADENAISVLKHGTENTFGSGMDLMHSIIVCLLELLADGYDFNSVVTYQKARKIVVQSWQAVEQVEKETNIVDMTFRACRAEMQRQASIKAIDNGYTYIECEKRTRQNGQSVYIDAVCMDDRDGYADEKIYHRMKQNIFTGECTQAYTIRKYQKFITELKLTDTQMRRLEMKAKGYSIEQIAGEEKTTRRAVQKSIEQARAKATEWLMAHEIDASAEVNAELFMKIAEQAEQAEQEQEQAEEQEQTYKRDRQSFIYWKNKHMAEQAQAHSDVYDFDYWKQAHADAEQIYNHEMKAREVNDAFMESALNQNMIIVKTPWSETIKTEKGTYKVNK